MAHPLLDVHAVLGIGVRLGWGGVGLLDIMGECSGRL
jgi:hypothetical protein